MLIGMPEHLSELRRIFAFPILFSCLAMISTLALAFILPAPALKILLLIGFCSAFSRFYRHFGAYKVCLNLIKTRPPTQCSIRLERGTNNQIHAAVGDEFGKLRRAGHVVFAPCTKTAVPLIGKNQQMDCYVARDGSQIALALSGKAMLVLLPRKHFDEFEMDDAANLDADLHVMRAQMLKPISKERAIAAYEAALKERPQDSEIIFDKARILFEQEKFAEADATVAKHIAEGASDAERANLLGIRAAAQFCLGNVDLAQELIDTALFLQPQNESLFYLRSLIIDLTDDANAL